MLVYDHIVTLPEEVSHLLLVCIALSDPLVVETDPNSVEEEEDFS
jgi:hypothetical protein